METSRGVRHTNIGEVLRTGQRLQLKGAPGYLCGMSSLDAVFRWTIGVSLLAHAAAFGSVWGVMGHQSRRVTSLASQDVWVGTTVSVVAEQTGHRVPISPEKEKISSTQDSSIRIPDQRKLAIPKSLESQVLHVDDSKASEHKAIAKTPPAAKNQQSSPSPVADTPSLARKSESIDLKQAMVDAANQKTSGSGTFGAVGVDLRERRLPAAFTRALPVAIGAEPSWWRKLAGSQGKVQFEVSLDEGGKIRDVTVEDESQHAFLARIVRRVGRLLAVGRYALPSSSAPNARQRFELRLDLQDGTPSSNETAEAGDAIDMGWEAPSPSEPGKAHIQEAKGRIMRAFIKLLPPKQADDGPRSEAPSPGEGY